MGDHSKTRVMSVDQLYLLSEAGVTMVVLAMEESIKRKKKNHYFLVLYVIPMVSQISDRSSILWILVIFGTVLV